MLLNDDIVDIETPDRICSPPFLHLSIFSIRHSRSTSLDSQKKTAKKFVRPPFMFS